MTFKVGDIVAGVNTRKHVRVTHVHDYGSFDGVITEKGNSWRSVGDTLTAERERDFTLVTPAPKHKFKVGDVVVNQGYATEFTVTAVHDNNGRGLKGDYVDLEITMLGRDGWWHQGQKFTYQAASTKELLRSAKVAPEGYVSVEAVEAEIARVARENGWCEDGQNETRKRLGIVKEPEFRYRMVIEYTEAETGVKGKIGPGGIDRVIAGLDERTLSGRKYRFVSQERI